MKGASCPYCDAPYQEKDGKCVQCDATFPWSADVHAIREEMKERETSFVRACITLFKEAAEAMRGGKPVSGAAIKGFVISSMYPRVVIALGSFCAFGVALFQAFVVVKQLDVMEQQTALLKGQTEAAQAQQAKELRDRISATIKTGAGIDQVARAFKTDQLKCEGACATVTLRSAVKELQASGFKGNFNASPRVSEAASLVLKELQSLKGRAQTWESLKAKELLLPDAQLTCFLPKEEADRMNREVARIIEAQPDEADWSGNTEEPIVQEIGIAFDAPDQPLLVEAFLAMSYRATSAVNDGLRRASELCARTLKADQETLKAIAEPASAPKPSGGGGPVVVK